MKLGEYIKNSRKEKGLTMQDLADACGLSKSYISMLENSFIPSGRKNNIVPSVQALKKLSKGLNTDMDYLLSMLDPDQVITWDEQVSKNIQTANQIPLYSSISCGIGMFVDDNIEDYIAVPDKYIDSNKDYFANTASGDSMIGKGIKDGDVLVFEKTTYLENGEIGSFCIDENEAVCKVFRRLSNGIILLESANEKYEPIEVDVTDECFRIIGKYKFRFTVEQK